MSPLKLNDKTTFERYLILVIEQKDFKVLDMWLALAVRSGLLFCKNMPYNGVWRGFTMCRKCKKPLVLLNSVAIFALEVLHTNK